MFFESIYEATIFSHSVLISEAIGGIVSSDSIVKQIKATSPLQVSSPPKYIKVFICLRSPWALFIMPVIEFLCEKVLWKPLISWVFSRLSWHLTNFVITQIVQGGSTFFFGQWNLTVSYNSTKPSYWAVRFWTKVVYFVACALLQWLKMKTPV